MTTQAGEAIIFKDQTYWIYEEPLQQWLDINPYINFEMYSTTHWRGYAGTWEIKDNKLFLNDIQSRNYTFTQLFKNTQPILADWFSGEIHVCIEQNDNFDGFSQNYHKFLLLNIIAGIVTEKQIVFNVNEEKIFSFGKYKDIPVLDVIKGKLTSKYSYVLRDYLIDLLQFLTLPEFEKNVCVSNFDLDTIEKSPGQPFKECGINFFLTPSYIAVNRQIFYVNEDGDEFAEAFSRNLERVLISDFTRLLVLRRNDKDSNIISTNTLLINSDIPYVIWAIKNVSSFSIPPHELSKTFKIKKLRTFKTNRLNSTVFEYTPIFIQEEYTFPESIQLMNNKKFTASTELIFVKEKKRYISAKSQEKINKEFRFYLDDNILFLDSLPEDKFSYLSDQNDDYKPYRGSYEKYGGYNGFDDDTIDDAFEGDPMNTWNVD